MQNVTGIEREYLKWRGGFTVGGLILVLISTLSFTACSESTSPDDDPDNETIPEVTHETGYCGLTFSRLYLKELDRTGSDSLFAPNIQFSAVRVGSPDITFFKPKDFVEMRLMTGHKEVYNPALTIESADELNVNLDLWLYLPADGPLGRVDFVTPTGSGYVSPHVRLSHGTGRATSFTIVKGSVFIDSYKDGSSNISPFFSDLDLVLRDDEGGLIRVRGYFGEDCDD